MKRIFALGVVLIFAFSCKEEKALDELTVRVKENKISCTGYEGQTECYLVQLGSKINSEEWEYFYEQIEGFVYEPGFVFTLLVARVPIKNPPADSPHISYSLIKELSKERK